MAAAQDYFRISRSATYGFLSALPLLVGYEVLILATDGATEAPVRVGADVWIKQFISLVGATGMFAIGLGVLVIGVWVFLKDRKQGLPLRPRYFGWMAAESLVYAVVVAALVSRAIHLVFAAWISPEAAILSSPMLAQGALPGGTEIGTARMLALSLGAGLYEELVFRVVLVGGLFWVLSRLTPRRTVAYVLAALVGAALFSAVHYIGAFGDDFTLPSFAFRFLFGLALNALFLARGFGVAAWTHAIYDVLVVTHLLG